MAQVNTGMGWSAEDSWLTQSANIEIARISEMGGLSFPNMPVAKNIQTRADCIAQGTPVYYWKSPYEQQVSYVACMDDVDCLIFVTENYELRAIATSPGARLCYAGKTEGWYPTQGSWTFDQTTGLYYSYPFNAVSPIYYGYYTSNITYFSTIRAALDAVVASNALFTKDSAGYAVACVAKWKTGTGTVITTPILISTDSEFTDMTDSSGTYNLAKLNMLLQGRRFYMAFFDVVGADAITSQFPVVDLSGESEPARTLEQVFMTIISTARAHVIIIDSPDPYEDEGAGSGEEGGDGEETGDDDAGIEAGSDFPSAINTGFCRIFSPSENELRDLSNYLWSNSYDLAQVKKLFSNPMDSILGLSAVPIRLLGSSVSFSLGGVPITGMTLPLVTQQRYPYHMGSITIKERWGSYLDYDPYTKFSIFLPFIGMRELAADDIMGKTISLVYDIDILTGMCVARLQAGTNCLYEWGGNCAIQLPINSRNWDSVFSTAVSAVGGIVSAVTGGSAPLVAGSVASAALQTVSMKPRIDKSSTIGGAAGWLGQMTPYIIRTTPEAFIPTDQNKFIGYPAYINVSLGEISGYNEVESIHLENVTATGAELEEIESILKGGVIF